MYSPTMTGLTQLPCLLDIKRKNIIRRNTNPSFALYSEYAYAKISAALPLPSAMTTGMAGVLVTDSNTVRIVFRPPSRTNSTTGIPFDSLL